AVARVRPMPLPPPPPAPVATEPRNRWRTPWLWLMIGLLIGLLTSSGVTIALAQLGAVHLELVRNQDELAEDIKAKQNELGNLQDQLEKAGENLQSKEARAKVLDEQHGRQEKQVTELSAKIRASSEEQKRVEEDLRKAR